MVKQAAACFRIDVREAELFEVQVGYIGIEEADRIVIGNIVFDGIRHEGYLIAMDSFDKFHDFSASMNGFYHIYHRIMEKFHTVSG